MPPLGRTEAGRLPRAWVRAGPASQRGQALVFATVTLAAVLLVLLVLFSSSQLTSERMELQNTADATAYSVATIAARDYNFSAYMNRAMVANQVTVGQIVGIASWNEFVAQIIEDVEILCDALLPEAAAFCEGVKNAWKTYETTYEKKVAPSAIKGLGAWVEALATTQNVFHYAMAEAVLQNLLPSTGGLLQKGVLAQNDPDASLLKLSDQISDVPEEVFRFAALTKGVADWWRFSKRYGMEGAAERGRELERFAEVVQGNRDGFLRARNWSGSTSFKSLTRFADEILKRVTDYVEHLLPGWLKTALDKIGLLHSAISRMIDFTLDHLVPGDLKAEITRAGGTDLKQGGKDQDHAWASVDTLQLKMTLEFSMKIPWPKVKIVPPELKWGWKRIHFKQSWPLPLGWGSSIAKSPQLSQADLEVYKAGNYEAQYGTSFKQNPEASWLAVLDSRRSAPLSGYKGVSPYQDVADPAKHRGSDGPAFLFVVSKERGKIRTAQVAGFGAPAGSSGVMKLGSLRLEDPDFKRMYVLSKAGLHFGKQGQYANLFNPYWEARLVEVSDAERAIAVTTAYGLP